MIVRRLAARRLVKTGSTQEEPKRKRAARFFVVILFAGALSGIAAWLNIWPFGSVHALIREAVGSKPPQISAQTAFPPVQPTHKTVDVYDPAPPPARSQPTAPPTAPPTARPTRNPGASPTPPDE